MAVAVVKTGRLIAQLTSEVERKQWGLLQQLMRFFLLGYLATALLLLFDNSAPLTLLVGVVFFVGALFVLKTVETGHRSIASLEGRVRERTRELEDARKAAEAAVVERTRFMANVSHEIRTPMNAVVGLSNLLLESELQDKHREDLLTLRDSGNVLLRVVTDVLDFAKMESDSFHLDEKPFSLDELLDSTVAMWKAKAREQKITLVCLREADWWPYWRGDRDRIQQILHNLVANAIRFTDRGGVTIEADVVEGRVVLRVRDTGCGIPTEDQEAIFHSFRQSATDRGGTGLGLALCYRLADAMKGRIQVSSEPGKGSCFTIELPLTREEKFRETKKSETPSGQGDWNVLLADDNEVNRKVAERYLARLGCRVKVAANGREAVDLADQEVFDLILMDCQMPVMTGQEATREIRAKENGRRVPIYAFTAMATSDELQACLEGGMDGYITKPIRKDKLEELLMGLGL